MTVEQHAEEIERNVRAWEERPLLREIYAGFYDRIAAAVPHRPAGKVIEIGSGIGNLKTAIGDALLTDVMVHHWLDVACSAYRLPFRDDSAGAIVLFDVLHHLRRPLAALAECARVLAPGGRVIIFDVFISLTSFLAYEIHPERVKWRASIDLEREPPEHDDYYAAQGNATRLFFRSPALKPDLPLELVRAEAFAAWHYLLSGGFSSPALYPRRALPLLRRIDAVLSRAPRLFGGRCLVVLEKR